ncbi:MAG: transcriptional repressor [Acidimicrobiaceae bacterium]|nr:transcriptional repressor [Acidimicrobiaceae bacterium]MYF44269.1 transcriptional repressor [Acidimicrobiaceae bacterium]MYJ37143.1 transcriptional repressor [Acidimicrobiaceae bacterium]
MALNCRPLSHGYAPSVVQTAPMDHNESKYHSHRSSREAMTSSRDTKSPLSTSDLHAAVSLRLAHHDYRYTRGRRRLVEAILAAGQPVTLPDIVVAAPGLAPSSVYRNLDVLERSGVVNRITAGGGHAYFEFAEPLLSHHHHLVCVDCGSIEDVFLDDELEASVDRSLAEVAGRAGFTPLRHSLDLHGRCAGCGSG